MLRSGTPASRSRNRLAAHRSNSQAPVPSGRRNGRGPNASRAAFATSAPTWYRSGPIAGPIPARTLASRAPRVSMAASAAPVARATVPRHPACTQASTRARGSYSRTGTQSATSTASTGPGSSVTRASASPTVLRGAAPVGAGHHADRGPVYLPGGDEVTQARADRGGRPTAVLHHVARLVAHREAQVQRGVHACRDAPVPGGDDPFGAQPVQGGPGQHPQPRALAQFVACHALCGHRLGA